MQDGFLHAVALRRGESPMSIFGHPEVYICAPLCLVFPLFLKNGNMLSCYFCIKTYSPSTVGNDWIKSGNKSQLRGPINLENFWRVTTNKIRFTKLILFAYFPLDVNFTIGNKLIKSWFSTRMYREPLTTDLRHSNQLNYEKQRSKFVNYGISRTTGISKWRKPQECGGSVRELRFRCFSSNSNITANASASLKELRETNKIDKKHVNDKLIHIVSDLEVLILSYELIKSKPGNSTPGSDSFTLDKLNMDWFKNASKSLLAGKYKFKPARRAYIPKNSKKDKRPLTISGPRDKIVQQTIYLILDAIFESSFLNVSHGSRPNKGDHSALKAIKYSFGGVKWCIEADIKSNFPSISHKILLKLLKRRISCSKFLALIKNSLKAGYLEDGKFKQANLGLFQGNVTSPILNNIYLHELDIFMAKLGDSFTRGKSRRKSPIYRRFSYLMEKETDSQKIKNLRRERRKVDSKDPLDPSFKRLYYIRYVDDFVVGIVGSRKDAVDIQEKIRVFLLNDLKLTLHEEKTFITQFSKNFISF